MTTPKSNTPASNAITPGEVPTRPAGVAGPVSATEVQITGRDSGPAEKLPEAPAAEPPKAEAKPEEPADDQRFYCILENCDHAWEQGREEQLLGRGFATFEELATHALEAHNMSAVYAVTAADSNVEEVVYIAHVDAFEAPVGAEAGALVVFRDGEAVDLPMDLAEAVEIGLVAAPKGAKAEEAPEDAKCNRCGEYRRLRHCTVTRGPIPVEGDYCNECQGAMRHAGMKVERAA